MPPGPPPYPVTYKQFFITDPRTGKQTMKIQMIPVDKPSPKQNEVMEGFNEDEENDYDALMDDFDEVDDSKGFWTDFLDQYYQERTHGHDH